MSKMWFKRATSETGFTRSGSQRYKCRPCGAVYTPEPKEQGYGETMRRQAIRLHVDGMGIRQIARHCQISPQTVSNWIKAYADQLPATKLPILHSDTIEMDELYTFVGKKTEFTSSP